MCHKWNVNIEVRFERGIVGGGSGVSGCSSCGFCSFDTGVNFLLQLVIKNTNFSYCFQTFLLN